MPGLGLGLGLGLVNSTLKHILLWLATSTVSETCFFSLLLLISLTQTSNLKSKLDVFYVLLYFNSF